MASIVLSIIGCIDYLAYGTIFTRAMFLPKKKLNVFFLPEKPEMSPGEWCVAGRLFARGQKKDYLSTIYR